MAEAVPGPLGPMLWFDARGRWLRLGLVVVLGAAAALGLAPFGWPIATVAALTLVLGLAARAGARAAFGIGWAFGAGYFGLALHWIMQPFQIDAARDGWMAPFALVLMAGGLALFWGAALAGAAWLVPGRGTARLVALVTIWTGAEVVRASILTGFPWAQPGHVWIDTPIAQLAATAGPFGLTLVTFALAAVLAGIGARRWLAAPAVAVACMWFLLDPGPAPAPLPDAPVVRLVQPNVPQALKWDPDLMQDHFDRLIGLTAAGGPVDLIVWPETALPYLLEHAADLLATGAVAAQGAPLVLGIMRREGASSYYNSLILLDDLGQVAAVYDKSHLVPFGEYMPLGEVLARWGIHGLAAAEGGGYAAGPGPQLIAVPGIGPALPLICYEGIFAEQVNAVPGRARLIVLITNDAWFGHFAGPYQHLAQARLRAIEQGLPLVRVANTGVSALIDGRGRMLGQIGLDRAGALDLALPPALAATPYMRFGDWPVLTLLAVALLALSVRRRAYSG